MDGVFCCLLKNKQRPCIWLTTDEGGEKNRLGDGLGWPPLPEWRWDEMEPWCGDSERESDDESSTDLEGRFNRRHAFIMRHLVPTP